MSEEIDRWIKFMKDNPTKWKAIHTKIINAYIKRAIEKRKQLFKNPIERERFIAEYNVGNKKWVKECMDNC
ncbi:MAG: hypothetical protein PHO02_05860 [Candidatus Nanoarchaeia archaeon]|nr:hypothetical protein [Candidatus Nanoarchaeia archaeon]